MATRLQNIKGLVNISDSPQCRPRPSRDIGGDYSTGTYGSQLAVSPSYQIAYASATGQVTLWPDPMAYPSKWRTNLPFSVRLGD